MLPARSFLLSDAGLSCKSYLGCSCPAGLPRTRATLLALISLKNDKVGPEPTYPQVTEGPRVTLMRAKSILWAEFRSISRAPLSFGISMLSAALIMWLAMKRNYEHATLHYEGELRLAVAQRDEYREKLKGASPDQAASTIAHLEDELAVLHTASIPASISKENVWPALTPNQIASMSEMLRRYSVSPIAVFFVGQNSESFRISLNEVFSRALWPPPVARPANAADGTGITVRSRPNDGPTFALVSLLRGVGYKVSHVADPANTEVQIYILNKPQ
jgi:hypothetical protein